MSKGSDFPGEIGGGGELWQQAAPGFPFLSPHPSQRLCLWAPSRLGVLSCPPSACPLRHGWAVGPARGLHHHRLASLGLTRPLSSWERAAQGPLLCPFCANTGQDILPGRHSGSPVPCRWVQEFLNEENRGLDVLLEYLAFVQCSVT